MPDSDEPEKEPDAKGCNVRLRAWLDSLPPGAEISILLPGDDGYEEAKAGWVEQIARESESSDE
jgi:hypothetical protein